MKSGNSGWRRRTKFSVLAAAADIDAPSAGFLDDGSFSLRLEMRIKHPDNESFHASVVDETTTCEVKTESWTTLTGQQLSFQWKLKNVRDMSPSIIKSDAFEVGGCKM